MNDTEPLKGIELWAAWVWLHYEVNLSTPSFMKKLDALTRELFHTSWKRFVADAKKQEAE